MYDPGENKWKLKYNNAAGRLWRYLESQCSISKKHLKRMKRGKIKPGGVIVINFKDWGFDV
jgi:hypothetical protein